MSDTACEQLRRILHLIPRIADVEPTRLDSLRLELGIDAATLQRDLLSIIQRFDGPGGFVEGVQLFLEGDAVSVISSSFRRPMRLTIPELRALELGLAILRLERTPDEHRAIDGARARLRKVIASLPDDGVDDDVLGVGDAPLGEHTEMLRTIRQAIRARRKVTMFYRKADADLATPRLVSPYAVMTASGHHYIVAATDESDEVRLYRLDRVESAQTSDVSRRELPDFTLDDVMRDGVPFVGEVASHMRVRYGPRIARWIAEREGRQVEANGSLVMEHPMADERWAVRHLLQYGPDAEVLEPASLRLLMAEQLSSMDP